jgi:hypothetical protein
MQFITLTLKEVEITDSEVTRDLEQWSLPLQEPAINTACALFTPEEVEDDDLDANDPNIMNIIGSCLKIAKRATTTHVIKLLLQLTAVSEYVKLCVRYQKTKVCKRLCLSASIAIACRMGKGPYFAHQI